MVRSAESIADNIAEGCGAATNAEFARYLDMTIKSSSELENQIERAHGYALIRSNERVGKRATNNEGRMTESVNE